MCSSRRGSTPVAEVPLELSALPGDAHGIRRYLYFATESRKRDPEFYGSPTLTDEEQVDDDTEQESEAGGEPAVDPETRSWIMPDRDESPDSTKHKLKVNEPESDTESEELDPDEDPYDFGVISGSDKAVSPEAGLERDIPSPEPVSQLDPSCVQCEVYSSRPIPRPQL